MKHKLTAWQSLEANYSIKKGDAYTASRILNKNLNSLKLLEIKFFSNLVSGNFDAADKVSNKIKTNGKNNNFFNLPQYILKIKNNDFRGSLEILKNHYQNEKLVLMMFFLLG